MPSRQVWPPSGASIPNSRMRVSRSSSVSPSTTMGGAGQRRLRAGRDQRGKDEARGEESDSGAERATATLRIAPPASPRPHPAGDAILRITLSKFKARDQVSDLWHQPPSPLIHRRFSQVILR